MCGIAGMYSRHKPADSLELKAMAATLKHRGPDADGFHVDGGLGLAHTRLSIIDLQGGNQPLYADDKRLVLVANGEIYNYVELIQELSGQDYRFQTHSDCETLLHAYRRDGDDFLQKIHGMFAFALYDSGERKLWLVRDRLGIKPLFYCMDGDRLLFASEMKALFAVMKNKPRVNGDGLAQYLQSQFCSGADTVIEGIKKVLPGEALCFDANLNATSLRYWQPFDVTPRNMTYAEAEAEFDDLFETVMTQHMRSDVPFGLFLSAGVDSSVLLAQLTRLSDKRLRTFSVGFPGTRAANELPAAKQLADRFHTEHTELAVDAQAMLQRLPYTVWCADDLMRDNANLPTSLLSQTAAASLKVVFSGEGGDEAFGGYGRYRSRGPEAWVKNMMSPGSGGFRTRGDFRGPWAKRVFGNRLWPHRQAFRRPVIDTWRHCPGRWSDLQRKQTVDITTALVDNLLVKADRMLMGFALEGRVPFLDHRVVEFGLSLPDDLKIHQGEKKYFLKQWASRRLPRDLLFSRKKGFVVPMNEWLTPAYLDRLEQLLPAASGMNEWFQADGVRALINRQRHKGTTSRHIWTLVQFALWHRLFIEGDGQPPDPLTDPLEVIG